mgnify:CR=1 FL=1
MKATTIIIAAVLSLQVSTLFAGYDFPPLSPNNNASPYGFAILVPTTPAEANFDDDAPLMEVAALAPVTPVEANLSDVVADVSMDINTLAPVTPAAADFNDDINQTIDFIALAPTTPAEADFSDTL